jgi:glucosamine-6-phosphate deaminase
MRIHIDPSRPDMARSAAQFAAEILVQAITTRGEANLVLATGASQFEMLASLVTLDIDWSKVVTFHLDEYIGLPATHPASFGRYLKERFTDQVPHLKAFHAIQGIGDAEQECARLGQLISSRSIDLACIGIGENGHLAFNDPPADFDTILPYRVVNLDSACRSQQVGEGWFPALDDVPTQAISMSIRQILASRTILCTVPDLRKASAVQKALEGPVTPLVPASILQTHPHCDLFMDAPAASLLHQPASLKSGRS